MRSGREREEGLGGGDDLDGGEIRKHAARAAVGAVHTAVLGHCSCRWRGDGAFTLLHKVANSVLAASADAETAKGAGPSIVSFVAEAEGARGWCEVVATFPPVSVALEAAALAVH